MAKLKFIPNPDTSYSAGIACLVLKTGFLPKIILILQKAGEKNALKGGGAFIEKRTWKMPMGHFDPKKDSDLINTAIREFQEETGLEIKKSGLSLKNSVALKIRSDRPGYEFHEDRFFLALLSQEPPKNPQINIDPVIEETRLFPLDSLPLDNNPAMGATLARGQRKKLSVVILNCHDYLIKSGINKEILKKALNSLYF